MNNLLFRAKQNDTQEWVYGYPLRGVDCCGDCVYYNWKKHRCTRGAHVDTKPASEFFADCPLRDVQPIVRGKWIPVPSSDMATGKAYKCSECEKMRYGAYLPNYCQCCGAKMEVQE